jgi:anti-anti-sigma factor
MSANSCKALGMENKNHFYEKDGVQVLVARNFLYEIENKEILASAISRIEKGFTNFVVDFSDMPYMNSVGLSFIINLMLKLKEVNGKLILVNVNKTIVKLMIITKVHAMFTLKDSIEQAINFILNNK